MTRPEVDAFVREWIRNWNARDLVSILAHFADEDLCFTSPKMLAASGTGTLTGKAALREYWAAGFARIKSLHFTLDHAIWDDERQELVIMYIADLNGQRNRACEVMRFNAENRVIAGEALYGIAVSPPQQ